MTDPNATARAKRHYGVRKEAGQKTISFWTSSKNADQLRSLNAQGAGPAAAKIVEAYLFFKNTGSAPANEMGDLFKLMESHIEVTATTKN